MDNAILYVLAAPMPGTHAPAYLMHEVGGVDCVLAYTDLEHLVDCCGEHQPWLGVRIDALMADLRDQRLPGPVVNLPLDPAARWTADGPPWDSSRLREADEVVQPEQGGPAVPAAVPTDAFGGAAGSPAPDASEFAGWGDDADEAANATAIGAADTITMDAGTVPAGRREWWR